MEIRRDEDDRMVRLYKASTEGCIGSLNSLMEEDPLILSKISVNPFGETPLHISASLGHLYFSKQLVSRKPKLAEELDLLKRSPLHLSSAEGHTEVVQALIEVNKDMCLVRDEDGKIPLHYAAMRGRVEVIEKLINAEPKSIQEKLNEGETVLHLCVQYNQLEALKVLVGSLMGNYNTRNNEFLNSRDQKCGNTILHLAVMLKQIETIEFLLTIPEMVRGATSTLNQSGFTAFEMVEHLPKDFKSVKIQNIILQDVLGLQRQKHDHKKSMEESDARASSNWKYWWSNYSRYMETFDVDWIKNRSGALMIVASMITTMTFQSALNPPGGVWQDDKNSTISGQFDCGNSTDNFCLAGSAVLANLYKQDFVEFLAYDATAFLALLTIIFLLISGFPVKYKPCMWLLNLAIFCAVTSTTLTFMNGVYLVAPINIEDLVYKIYKGIFYSWIGLVGIVILLHTIRLVFWAVNKLPSKLKIKFRQCIAKCTSGNHNDNTTADADAPAAHV